MHLSLRQVRVRILLLLLLLFLWNSEGAVIIKTVQNFFIIFFFVKKRKATNYLSLKISESKYKKNKNISSPTDQNSRRKF
jgi:hypothetical protein